jgi:hypothetical protein
MKKLLFTLTLLCAGCMTITQHAVKSNNASYDNNVQNSGIISSTMGGFKVTAHFRDRYNALVDTYGDAKLSDKTPIFTPALVRDGGITANSDGTYTITKQAMMWMVQLSELKRRGFKP